MSKKIGTITGLQWALASIATNDQPPGPDEFTLAQVYEAHYAAGGTRTIDGVRGVIDRERRIGKLTSRKGRVDGKSVTIYKRVSAGI